MLPGDKVCISPLPDSSDFCPAPAKSSTWEPIEEQYVSSVPESLRKPSID